MKEEFVWILIVIVILLLARRSFQAAAPLGTRWLNFWTYFLLPIGGFLDFSQILTGSPALTLSPAFPVVYSIALTAIVIRVVLAIGLHYRKGWAWKWNWVFIASVWLCPTSQGLRSADEFWGIYVTKIIGFGFVWMLPNYVYWKKRRVLFSGCSQSGQAPLINKAGVSEMTKKADKRPKAVANSDFPSEPSHRMATEELLDIETDTQVKSKKSKIEPDPNVTVAEPQSQRTMGWRPNIPQRIIFVILTIVLLCIAGDASYGEKGLVTACLSAAAISAAISIHKISNPFKRRK